LSGRYEARNDDLTAQMADLTRRTSRLEALLLSRTGGSYGAVGNTDYLTPPQSTTSTTFQPAYYLYPNDDAQALETYLRVVTPAGVTMEVRIVDNSSSAILSPVVTIPASSNTFQGLRARSLDGTNIVQARLEFRVASGAGTVRVGVLRIVGGNFQQGTF
jgi:hypothetical protein